MTPGFRFNNHGMEVTLVAISEKGNHNVVLLVREASPDCPYITAIDLDKEPNGNYSWYWGHYFKAIDDAYQDYIDRINN